MYINNNIYNVYNGIYVMKGMKGEIRPLTKIFYKIGHPSKKKNH